MNLAIEQANLSIPVPSGYCVGAVLVKETHQDLNPSEVPVADRFQVLATGYSRELPGNTHAEECCLLKLMESQGKETELLLDDPLLADLDKKKKREEEEESKNNVLGHGHKPELTMYCTMEPCSTRLSGNRPCCERLIESGVRRVYVGVREPDHFVKTVVGVENMVRQGIEVIHIPGFENQCLAPNSHILH
ncbi:hypothetical protein BGZ83_010631 [Gryganskiella cystojenkinii]|nr:hypothetical protein BGZ83_010631 [Gryganskiella cystojenkinii]